MIDKVLESLRKNVESREAYPDGQVWGDVYLDNARLAGQNDKQFRACLASLSKQGLYKPLDGYAFGRVKM